MGLAIFTSYYIILVDTFMHLQFYIVGRFSLFVLEVEDIDQRALFGRTLSSETQIIIWRTHVERERERESMKFLIVLNYKISNNLLDGGMPMSS